MNPLLTISPEWYIVSEKMVYTTHKKKRENMISEFIRTKYFSQHLNNGAETALYLQLRKGFSAWINDSEHETLFPSERELSAFLNVNRRTLRQALSPFLEAEILQRKGHKTFINHKIGAYKPEDGAASFSIDPSKIQIKILLFEEHPLQKQFWAQLIDKFNTLLPAHELVPVSAVCDYTDNCQYWDLIEQEKFDIAVLPVSYRWKKGIEEHFQPLKPAVKAHLQSDEFMINVLTETSQPLRDYTYPYLFTFPVAQYLKPYHIQNGKHVKDLSFEEMLSGVIKNIPEDIPLFNIYYDLCRGLGIPAEFSKEIILEHCNLILDRFDLIRTRKNAFAASGYSSPWKANSPGEMFCRQSLSNLFLYREEQDTAEYEDVLFTVRNGCYFWGGCGSVAICRSSEHHQEAFSFTEYLLSEPVQNTLWKSLRSAPVRVDSLKTLDFTTPEEALRYFNCCRENPRSYPAPVGNAMLPYLEQYLEGSLSREKIIDSVLRFYS